MTVEERDSSLDVFRGVTVALMCVANFTSAIRWIPDWAKHAPLEGLTVVDCIAPMFIVAIAASFRGSFIKRAQREGQVAAYRAKAKNAFMLIGIGAFFAAADSLVRGLPFAWGVLQALGVAELCLLACIRFPVSIRAFGALLLLAGYQSALHIPAIAETVLQGEHGGLFGAIGWSAFLLLADAFHELRTHRSMRVRVMSMVLGWVLAIMAGFIFPVAKRLISGPYVLLALMIAVSFGELVKRLAARFRLESMRRWGRHALALYVLHLALQAPFVLPEAPWWFIEAPWWLTVIQLAAFLFALDGFSRLLEARGGLRERPASFS